MSAILFTKYQFYECFSLQLPLKGPCKSDLTLNQQNVSSLALLHATKRSTEVTYAVASHPGPSIGGPASAPFTYEVAIGRRFA